MRQDSSHINFQKPIGAPPATLIHVGEQRVEHFSLTVTDYDEKQLHTNTFHSVADFKHETPCKKRWIVAKGLHLTDEIESLCKAFEIHPLIIEDILNTKGLPKIDEHDDFIFIRVKVPYTVTDYCTIKTQQLSFILLDNTIITFIEDDYPPLDRLNTRLAEPNSRIRSLATDYLTWALLDTVVDTALAFANTIEDSLEEIEERFSSNKNLPELSPIHGTRREIAKLYRVVRPLREVVNHINRSESPLFTKRSKIFYQDLTDHVTQIIEMTEYIREHASSIKELYFTTTSHKMNEVMTVLACVSAIFLPLTFLAGVYGMNFSHMPELSLPFAYPLLISLFFIIAVTMYRYFKRRGWL